MLAQSGARVKASDPVASVRYDDGSVREFALDRLRLADFRDSVPWRQVRSLHGQAHHSGSYASATMGGFVVYESRLELARLLLADFDPQVRGIYAQPFLLVARVGGRVRRHVPDFLLVSAAGTASLVNVKPAARLQDPKVAEALAWPGVLAERHGWEYEVWSGADPDYRRPPPESGITREWLEHEYVVKLRSIGALARERGVTAYYLMSLAKNWGLPIRHHSQFSGIGHLNLPAPLSPAMRAVTMRKGALSRLELITEIPGRDSIAAAARVLYDGRDGALRQQITKIETAAGFAIIDRSSMPLATTAAGHELIQEALQILRIAHDQ